VAWLVLGACVVAYRAGVIVGVVDDESERLRVVQDLLLLLWACNDGEEDEGEREREKGEREREKGEESADQHTKATTAT
jgi:hypothetical protein